jgi:hypothetical protein
MASGANGASAANGPAFGGSFGSQGYSNQGYGGGPWGAGPAWQREGWQGQAQSPPWGAPPPWAPFGADWFWNRPVASKPLWIALMVLAFIVWWPVGLATLFYLIWSGRMGCWRQMRRAERAGQGFPGQSYGAQWWRNWCGGERPASSSGNRAFDEYRAETLRRLEEEQQEFAAFLDRLRFAKDKAEFDQFMAERRDRPPSGEQPQPA